MVTWILPASAGLLIIWLALRLTDFYYIHAWASAHFATIAHFFATHGIIGLHGIPIENFDPLTTQPDNYLHWPPLYFYILSLVQRAFPDSIRAMHLFMAVIAIANALAMWAIASTFFKPRAAIVCGSAFLLMPATLRYGSTTPCSLRFFKSPEVRLWRAIRPLSARAESGNRNHCSRFN